MKGGLALTAAASSSVARSSRAGTCDPPATRAAPLDISKTGDVEPMRAKFLAWLFAHGLARDHGVRNMVFNFYEEADARGVWVYPMLTAKTMLWLMRNGRTNDALTMSRSLLRWQQVSTDGKLARSYGAFPSEIERSTTAAPGLTPQAGAPGLTPQAGAAGTPEWSAVQYYYSGDNLVILEALTLLYERTKDKEVLNSAIGIGTWLTSVMCNGKGFGVWVQDHGAPMYTVTGAGDFVNEIHTSEEMLWIGALNRLGRATSEGAYCRQAERAFAFLRNCQAKNGAYLDKYDPGYPPKPYAAERWKPYQPGQLVADSILRCALGSCRFGDLEAARKFHDWLQVEDGAVTAFIDAETGGSGFPATQKAYYDVTSSALHRSLCQWLGDSVQASVDMRFLAHAQRSNGGWYWGLFRGSLVPVELQLAPVVGLWATADLSSPID